jgi:hypothetical protein
MLFFAPSTMALAAMFISTLLCCQWKTPLTSVYIPQSYPPSSLVLGLAGDDCVPTLDIDDGDAITLSNYGSLTDILMN